MGALFFGLLMLAIFWLAVSMMAGSGIFLIIRAVRKHRGAAVKRRGLVIPLIVLALGMAISLIPMGWLAFLRMANSQTHADDVQAPSGQVATWGTSPEGTIWTESFVWNGVEYVEYLANNDGGQVLGEAAANVEYPPNALNDFMNRLFNYSDRSTLYPVENDSGFSLYSIGDLYGNFFCPREEYDAVSAYYNDLTHYDLEHATFAFSAYNGDESPVYEDVAASLTPEEFSAFGTETVSPAMELNAPDTYRTCSLYAYSRDGVCRWDSAWLAIAEGQGYWLDTISYDGEDGREVLTLRALPEDLNTLLLALAP